LPHRLPPAAKCKLQLPTPPQPEGDVFSVLTDQFPDVVNRSQCLSKIKHSEEHNLLTKGPPISFKFRRLDVWRVAHVDILGPLPISSEGLSYLLMVVDRTARLLKAMPKQDRETTPAW
jgi:hypothetical protein